MQLYRYSPWLCSVVYFKIKKEKVLSMIVRLFPPDFAEPLTMPGYGGAASAGASVFGATGLDNQPPEETVSIITSMGFHRNQAIQALRATVSARDFAWGSLL